MPSTSFIFNSFSVSIVYPNDSETIEAVRQVVETEWTEDCFFPYTRPSHASLMRVNLFVTAWGSGIPTSTEDSQAVSTFPDECNSSSYLKPQTLCGVLGVSWVPMTAPRSTQDSSRPQIEGYVQLVVVHPQYRGRGLAKRLLSTCLALREIHLPPKSGGTAVAGGAAVIGDVLRWRLHTMVASHASLSFLLPLIPKELQIQGLCRQLEKGHKEDDAYAFHQEKEKYEDKAHVRWLQETLQRTTELYRFFGFHVRRQLYKYYEKEADAVEMVCDSKEIQNVNVISLAPGFREKGNTKGKLVPKDDVSFHLGVKRDRD